MPSSSVRLTSFTVKAYRSCKKTFFAPHHKITGLVGVNGAGKTNVLQALLMLRGQQYNSYYDDDSSENSCQLSAEFSLRKKRVKYEATIIYKQSDNNIDAPIKVRERWNFSDFGYGRRWYQFPSPDFYNYDYSYRYLRSKKTLPTLLRREFFGKLPSSALKIIQAVDNFKSNISYYGTSQFTNPSGCPPSFEIDEEHELDAPLASPSHVKFMYDLYITHQNNPRLYESFMSLVSRSGVGLIDSIKWQTVPLKNRAYEVQAGGKVVSKNKSRTIVIPTIKIRKSILSFNQLSEGTFRSLATLFYIMTDRSSIILLEEPEICVHHGLLASVLEVIKEYSNRKQFIVSTHSESVLDHLEPENIFLVQNDDRKGTTVSEISDTMSKGEFAALKNYLQTAGTLGEYWRHSGFEK